MGGAVTQLAGNDRCNTVTQLAGNTMTMVMTDPAPKMVGFCKDATKHWN